MKSLLTLKKNVIKLASTLGLGIAVLTMTPTSVFAAEKATATLYKYENVDSKGCGDYLVEIKLGEGWQPYVEMKLTTTKIGLKMATHKGYPLGDTSNEYVLENVVGATLEDWQNAGTQLQGMVTNPSNGIIEVPVTICKDHNEDYALQGSIRLSGDYRYFQNVIMYVKDAKPISDRVTTGTPPVTPPVAQGKKGVQFTINSLSYKVTEKDGTSTIKKMSAGEEPYLSTGRTLVPVRYAGEALEATVEWNASKKEVIVRKDGTTVRLPLNSQYAIYSDGSKVDMGAKTVQKNGRTYVPVGALGQVLDIEYIWDEETQTVTFLN